MNLYRETDNSVVTLPATLTSYQGDPTNVVRIASDASPGRSGKVELEGGRIVYPGVVRCYIATEPRQPE